MADSPPKRRRILVTEIRIDRTGQYVAQPIRLPPNARRVTGVMTTTQLAGGYARLFMGWVIYGAPGAVPGAVLERWYDATRFNRLPTGINRLSGDLKSPEGFQLVLSDDIPLTLLRPAPGQATYVFIPQVLKVVFTDEQGHVVEPVRTPVLDRASDGGVTNPETLIYELPADVRVYFPPHYSLD